MRLFARTFSGALIALTALMPLACTAADDSPAYIEGKHYKKVRESASAPGNKRIIVEEFFWYGCGHCYAFEPFVEKWLAKKPDDVEFNRMPNSLGRPIGMIHSQTYYTAEALNLLDKVHRPFFDANQPGGPRLDSAAAIQAFFTEKTGVMPDVFTSTFNGFAVDSRVRRAEALAKQYAVASTPTVVVDGRYQINASTAGGFPEMVNIMDFLINKVRKERSKK